MARVDPGLYKVLKAMAEYYDVAVHELLDALISHAFSGTPPLDAEGLTAADGFLELYGVELRKAALTRWNDQSPVRMSRTSKSRHAEPEEDNM